MNELISIIIPVYNIEKYIYRSVNSIINQTYRNLEIILVDDGSDDKSGSICDEYKIKDHRIKIVHKDNAGLGHARNSGLNIATGKYVTFIDGDDYIGSTHIEDMYSLIVKTQTDTCMAGYTRVYSDRQESHKHVCSGKVYKGNIKEEILPRMCGFDSKGANYIEMSVCMVLFSNEIIRNNNLRFVSERDYVSEDLIFDFDYYLLSNGVCVSDLTDYYYCDNEGSLTTKYRKDRFASQIKLYELLSEKAEELGIGKQCIERLQNTVIAIARYSIKLEYKFEKENGRKEARENVRRICSDETLKKILAEYDDSRIRKASRAVNWLIKGEKYLRLEVTMKIKNILGI